MADVAATLAAWSSTTNNNSPAGTATVGTGVDDNFREVQGVIVRGLSNKGADIASAATTDVGAVEGLMHDITGTTTITSLGTVRAGIWKILKFEGALTLTHNATSLILPGGGNITTADGDVGIFFSEGSGNWRCLSYQYATDGSVPVGSVQAYAGSAAPNGWLLCYGQAVSRSTYARLFAIISTTYGTGDGVTTFNLPDIRGRAPFGKDDMGGAAASRITNAVSGITGTNLGAAGGDQRLHAHSHTISYTGQLNGGGTGGDVAQSGTTKASGTTGAGSSENMPPAIILNYIIKT